MTMTATETTSEKWLRAGEVEAILMKNPDYARLDRKTPHADDFETIVLFACGFFSACFLGSLQSSKELPNTSSDLTEHSSGGGLFWIGIVAILTLVFFGALFKTRSDISNQLKNRNTIKQYHPYQIIRGDSLVDIMGRSDDSTRKEIAKQLNSEQLKKTLEHTFNSNLKKLLNQYVPKAPKVTTRQDAKINEEIHLLGRLLKRISKGKIENDQKYANLFNQCLEAFQEHHKDIITKFLSEKFTKGNVKQIYRFAKQHPWAEELANKCVTFTCELLSKTNAEYRLNID